MKTVYRFLIGVFVWLSLSVVPLRAQSGGGSCDWMKDSISEQRNQITEGIQQETDTIFGAPDSSSGGGGSTVSFRSSSKSSRSNSGPSRLMTSVRSNVQQSIEESRGSLRPTVYRPGRSSAQPTFVQDGGSGSGEDSGGGYYEKGMKWADQAQESCLAFQDVKMSMSLTGMAMDQILKQLKKMAKKACNKAKKASAGLQEQAMKAATVSVEGPYGMGGSIGPEPAGEDEQGMFGGLYEAAQEGSLSKGMDALQGDLPTVDLTEVTNPTQMISDTQWEKVDFNRVNAGKISGAVASKTESALDDMTSGTQEQLEEYNEQSDVETDYSDQGLGDVMDEAVNNE